MLYKLMHMQVNKKCIKTKFIPFYTLKNLSIVERATVTDAELQALSQQLHIDDVNAVQGIVLNMQSTTTSGSTTDTAPLPLVIIHIII